MKKFFFLCALAALIFVPVYAGDVTGVDTVTETGLAPDGIPNPAEEGTGWVTSIGDYLSADEIRAINELIDGIERDTGAEIAVVVVPSLRDDIFSTAQELFDRWKIGKEGVDNGLLVIADIGGHQFRTHTGYGMEGLFTDAMLSYLQESLVIPGFKEGRYGESLISYLETIGSMLRDPSVQGEVRSSADDYARKAAFRDNAVGSFVFAVSGLVIVLLGLAFLVQSVSNAKKTARKKYDSYDRIARLERSGLGAAGFTLPLFLIPFGGVFLVIGVAVSGLFDFAQVALFGGSVPAAGTLAAAGAVLWAVVEKRRIIHVWREGPRSCPECSAVMDKLSETDDDKYLKPFQITEERIKAEDYDVWVCPACKASTVEKYRAGRYFLYALCPACGGQTAKQTARFVLVSPTYERSGQASLVFTCMSCKHEFSKVAIIPRLTRSSSSSGSSSSGGSSGGSSFGGGSSGGGGSTSSW